MNLLDVILLLGLVLTAARGAQRGALFQMAAFGGAAAGLVFGAWAAPRGASALVDGPSGTLALLTLGFLAVCVLVGQAMGTSVGMRLRAAVADAGAAGADRAAGIAVGIAGLVAVVWLLAGTLAQGPSTVVAQQIRESRVVTAIDESLPAPPDVFSRVGAYLDIQGFPQVFAGVPGGAIAPPVDPPAGAAVEAARQAGQPSTVQVSATGCGGVSLGSGFVPSPGYVVTNAHVVAGGEFVSVRDRAGTHIATPILVDPDVDLAVLFAPDVQAAAIAWADTPVERGTQGATLGFPGGQRELEVTPAAVRGQLSAVGRDIYGTGMVTRDVLTLSTDIRRGGSGGPFVTADGRVGGVMFAAGAGQRGTGYALDAASVRDDVADAIARDTAASTGPCRF